MKYAAAMAFLAVIASPAFAEDILNLPCDVLPATAVKVMPAPFDRYLDLVCTRSGQAIKAKPGFALAFEQGTMYLAAINPDRPKDISREAHYTALTVAPLSDAETAALRTNLRRIATSPVIDASTILRLRIETSTGAKKQIYLLVPTADGHVLGMECVTECKPIDKDPWFFTIVPVSELQK